MKKRITALLLTSLVVLLSACAGRISISDSEPIDNADNNEYYNGTEFQEGLWRTNDALYIRRFSKDWDLSGSSYTTQKIYKLTDAGQELIYSDKTEHAYSSDLQMRMYHGEFLDYYLHTDTESGHPEIWRLNMDSRQFEKYIELVTPDRIVPYDFFIMEDQLYFIAETDQFEDGLYIYRYDDGANTPVASKETIGREFLPTHYSKHYMYYLLPETYENLTDSHFYIYDLETKKTVKEYQLDFMAKLENNGEGDVDKLIFTDNYVYFTYRSDISGTYTLYRTNLNDMETTRIMENDNDLMMNSYGDTLYIAFTPENVQDNRWTLHILTPESDIPREICNINIRNIYLVDDKWVYFTDYGNTIYRILPTGENLQKVM
ncbi:MAG: hypothetical protein IJ598_06315 [Ruminococcus sp.]|nr:hypothetical protein [Ruminococcus sp.]